MPDSGDFKKDLTGDIAFLVQKEFDGKLRSDEGTLSATGDLATLTANTGKDMYLARANIIAVIEASGQIGRTIIVQLKVNAVIKDSARIELSSTSTFSQNGNSVMAYDFATGFKVVAGQIIKLEATLVDASIQVSGSIICFEEDTGVSPIK